MIYSCRENTTVRIEGWLKGDDGTVIGGLDKLTLTLYEKETGTIINSRDKQSILNVNGGHYYGSIGQFILVLSPADNQLVNDNGAKEVHVLLIEWEYNSSESKGNHILYLAVNPLEKVP